MPISRQQKAGGSIGAGLASGLAAGSIFGPIGAGIGGLIGLGAGYLGQGDTYQKTAKNQKKLGGVSPQVNDRLYNNLTQDQQNRANWAGNYAQQQFSNNQFNFDPIEQKAREGFQRNTLPGISNAFTQMGSGPESSAYWNAQLGAKGDLESSLASMRSKYGLEQQQILQNLFKIGQNPQLNQYSNNNQNNQQEEGNSFLRNFDYKGTYSGIKDLWNTYKSGAGAGAGNQSASQTVQSQFSPRYQSKYLNSGYQTPSLSRQY